MPELIDKIEALGKLQTMYIQIERACGDGNLVAKGVRKAYKAIERMPTIEADIDCAEILRLCNEIEEIVTAIANWSKNWQTVDDCRTVCDKLKEIGKELTGDAGTD